MGQIYSSCVASHTFLLLGVKGLCSNMGNYIVEGSWTLFLLCARETLDLRLRQILL